MNKTEKAVIYFSFVFLILGLYWFYGLGSSFVEIGVGLLLLTMVILYGLEVKKNRRWKMRSKKLQTTYLIFILLLWGILAMVVSISLIQLAAGYLLFLFMVLYMRKKEKEDSIESPLSDIELNDIKLSEEEYTRGEAPIFDSIEDMLDHIGEEE